MIPALHLVRTGQRAFTGLIWYWHRNGDTYNAEDSLVVAGLAMCLDLDYSKTGKMNRGEKGRETETRGS